MHMALYIIESGDSVREAEKKMASEIKLRLIKIENMSQFIEI